MGASPASRFFSAVSSGFTGFLKRFQALPRPRPRPRTAGGAACAGATGCCCLSHSLSSRFCSALSVLPSPPTTRTKPFDLLQLEEKVGHAMQVLEIYTRHPSWDRGSRRLSVPSTIGTSSRGRDARTSRRSTSRWRGPRGWRARAHACRPPSSSLPVSWILQPWPPPLRGSQCCSPRASA